MPQTEAKATAERRFAWVREMGDMQRLAHRQVAGFDLYHHIMAASWPDCHDYP